LHRDALGSIVATTDGSGKLKSEIVYDAFGNITEATGQSANKFGYTGHQMDAETGLVYFQARYYDPQLGRFITQDPYEGDWKTPLSLHHYLYAYANPTVYVDLNGYESTISQEITQWRNQRREETGQIAGALAGAGVGIAEAIYGTAKFVVYDAVPATFDNEGGKARMREHGKNLAVLLLQTPQVIATVKGEFAKADAQAAVSEAQGNHGTAGFERTYSRARVVAPILAAIASARVPTLPKAGPMPEVPKLPAIEKPPMLEAPLGPKSALAEQRAATIGENVGGPGVQEVMPAQSANTTQGSAKPMVFKRIEGKSVRKTDYPTRIRKQKQRELEAAATDEKGVIRCQSKDCEVPGGRELEPGKGSPQHIPELVQTHNSRGYNVDQPTRNDLYNDTAKEWHCIECQRKEGGGTTETYRRDVGPEYKPRPKREPVKKESE
ncbi:RHS repeat domain-containing protein, partial [Duganella sp. Root336D2]|uniref:RHS repeat domain-containing protein n=1 Tax=Duganella sp. Root336D2 TaxID=1736518 RepID=UPI00138EF9DC